MTGNVEEADTRRDSVLSVLESRYTKKPEETILQSLHLIVEYGGAEFEDIGLITVEDVISIEKKVDESVKYGERFEVIADLRNRLDEFWNQYEEGVISLPSFVARFEDALLQITEGGDD